MVNQGKKPTIADVAAHARVGTKTVSRYLNGEPYISAELRERIEMTIAKLGYVPNRAARQLAGSRSFVIAMFFANVNANYMTDLLMSAANACRDVGYHLVSEPLDLDGRSIAVIERSLASVRPDGAILLPPFSDNLAALDLIRRSGIPVARIASTGPEREECIAIEDDTISEALVRHLIERGHRRIGIVEPRPDQTIAQGRARGYRAALAAADIAFDPALTVPGTFLFESGIRGGTALLDLPSPPTAIFATNDEMALGVLAVAQERGLRVPDHLAVAGFDDSNASRMTWPALTTVRQPLEAMAQMAVALLLERPYLGPPLRHELLLRRSTGD